MSPQSHLSPSQQLQLSNASQVQLQAGMLAAAGAQYTVYVNNNSGNAWTFYMYQQPAGGSSPGVLPLAWFAAQVQPSGGADFSWSTEYDFRWALTGALMPGLNFVASQISPADPNGSSAGNAIDFGVDSTGAPSFSDMTSNGPKGALTVNLANTVPMNTYSVGIGMSGAAAFALQAQPKATASFNANPTYWLAFGSQVQAGMVLEPFEQNCIQLTFPPNVSTLYATLNEDGMWMVSPNP
jgi:hypothetical protein